MISKEKLLNGYIENDKGKLRKLWVSSAIHHDFDVTWVDESECFDNLHDALDNKYCFLTDYAVDSADSETYIKGKNKLTTEDFVDVSNIYQSESITTSEDLESLRKSDDIFQQMLKVAQDNNLFIQFDGFTENSKDTIVVTHAYSDTEYVVTNKQEFDKLVESFEVLEKFERK